MKCKKGDEKNTEKKKKIMYRGEKKVMIMMINNIKHYTLVLLGSLQ